jgi:hypothetical protein
MMFPDPQTSYMAQNLSLRRRMSPSGEALPSTVTERKKTVQLDDRNERSIIINIRA